MSSGTQRTCQGPPSDDLARADTLYRGGDYATAAALLLTLLSSGPLLPGARRLLGLCRLREGQVQEAIDLLDAARTEEPDNPWAALHYALGLQAAGRHRDAADLLRPCCAALGPDPTPWLNLSCSLLALGDTAGAIRTARKGRLHGHQRPESHYTLGLAYLGGDFFVRAAECFQAATRLAPDFADAWVNLGVARYRAGQIEPAKDAMRAALRADPGNVAARTNLATFLRLTGHGEAAETMLRGILDTHPDAAAARINLAADLMRENRSAEALALLDRPPPEDAETAQHWRLQQILALIRLNRAGEARVLTDTLGPVPPALQPLLEWRQALSALADRDAATATEHARRMEAALEAMPSMLPEHRIMGHYDLAKFWSLLQSPDRAIRHWTEGHRLLSRFQPFSREAYRAFVDASIAAFDAACLAPSRAAANRDGTPVFVIGMPRSGTTLIEQILHAHADVHGAGERSELGMVFSELGGAAETPGAVRRIASLDSRSLDPVADRYLAALHALAPAAHRIVDKMPGNFRYLGLVARLLPNARIIACERDPRDIGFSIFTFRFFGAHPYAHDLSDLGWYIGQHDRLMAHWRRVLPNPILTVRLQDWVDDFNATLHRTLNFLDLPYDPACEHFHEVERRVRTVSREQVRQPIHARGIGRWREYEQSLAPLIAALREENVLKDT